MTDHAAAARAVDDVDRHAERPAAKIRAEMSVPPPASQGTMIRIGRSG
jgi:hypothetical protein